MSNIFIFIIYRSYLLALFKDVNKMRTMYLSRNNLMSLCVLHDPFKIVECSTISDYSKLVIGKNTKTENKNVKNAFFFIHKALVQ